MKTSPAPNHNKLIDAQFGAQSTAYLQSSMHSSGPEFKVIETLLDGLSDPDILDLGCGAGHVSFCAAPLSRSVIAYDLSEQMLTTVRQAAKDKDLNNIKTRLGAVESLPFEDASFDVIISRFSAHHWQHLMQALLEMRRVIKPTGLIIIIDIIAPPVPLFDSFLQTIEMLRDPSHVRDYSAAQWLASMGQAGFCTQSMTTHKLTLDFDTWISRMRTPEHYATSIKALQSQCSQEVRNYFAIQNDGSFTTDVMTLVTSP